MTKRDFVALADALRPFVTTEGDGSIRFVDHGTYPMVKALLGFLEGENPGFMAGRWISYLRGECGPNGGRK